MPDQTYVEAWANTESLIHRVRPGIEPASSQRRYWVLNLLSHEGTPWLVSLYFIFLSFLGLHLWHMEIPRLGVELELRLPAYATVAAIPDPSHICDLLHSSRHLQILNPLIKASDQTCNLMVPSRICFCCTMTETPPCLSILYIIVCIC